MNLLTLRSRRATVQAAAAALLLLAQAATAQTAPPPAQAVPAGPWTLQAAVDYALANNLNLRNSDLTSQLDQATLQQNRAALLPAINGQGTHTYQYGTSVDPVTYEFQNNTIRANNFSLNGSVPLYQGGALRNTIKRSRLSAAASAQDVEKARTDLLLNVASGYLQVLLAREALRAAEIQRSTTVGQVDRAEKQLKAGAIAESNVLDVRAQLATEDVNVITAQNNLTLATLRLEQQLNLDPAQVSPAQFQIAEPQLPDPPADEVIDLTGQSVYEAASQTRPEIKAADLRLQAALKGVDVARGNYWPRLSFGASLFTAYSSQRSTFIPTGDTVLRPVGFGLIPGTQQPDPGQVVYSFQPGFEQKPTNFTNQIKDNFGKQIGFTLTVPILNGLQTRTQVTRAKIQAQQAQLNADQSRLTLRQNIEQAVADAEAARRRYQATTRQLEALSRSLQNADIRFANGLLNGTDYNQIKNNQARALNDRLQAKYDYIFKRKVLDLYMGRPLEL